MKEKSPRAIVKSLMLSEREKELTYMWVKFFHLVGTFELQGLKRETGLHMLEQEAASFLQIQNFSSSQLSSFQPSPLNSAQCSCPSLLGSPGSQYFNNLENSRECASVS